MPLPPSRFELIIFDCDGVLVDSEPVANTVFAQMLGELGLSLNLDDMYREFMGRSMQACLETVTRMLGRAPPAGFEATLRRRTHAALARTLQPVEGVAQVLDALRVPCCVASSGDHDKMHLTLGVTGLLPRLEGRLFSATDVARGKPHPDLFLHAARALGAAPARTAVVEDSCVGVQAGVAAGMTVFGYAALTDADALHTAGATVFRQMRELPALLDGGR